MSEDLSGAGRDEPVGSDEPVDPARAGGVHVERTAGEAEFVLDGCRRRRHGAVGRRGREDEQIDVGGVDAGHLECSAARLDRQTGGGSTDVAFADAGAFDDPVVVGVHRLREVVVGDDAIGQGGSPPGDHRATRAVRYCWHQVSSPRWS